MKIIHKNLTTIMRLILKFKWKNLLWQAVIFTEVHRNSLIKFTKKTKEAVCNPDRFKKPMKPILIHISPIINSTILTIQANLLLKCMVRETLDNPIILVSWTSPISNLGQVLRMFKDHRIVNLLKILTVFITTIILTAPEMVIATIDKVAWAVNKQKLLYLDRIVLLVLIMTNIT